MATSGFLPHGKTAPHFAALNAGTRLNPIERRFGLAEGVTRHLGASELADYASLSALRATSFDAALFDHIIVGKDGHASLGCG